MYRSLTLALAAALMAPLSQAMAEVNIEARCEIDSGYDLTVQPKQLKFTRQTGKSEVIFAQGSIYVDGSQLVLNSADRQRAADFEQGVRALIPDVKAIASDAVEIAFTALNRVIDTFASADNRATFLADLSALRVEIDRAIAHAESTRDFDDQAFEAKVKAFASSIAPRIAGEFAASAVSAALSGDEAAAKALEAKAKQLEQDIEASVEAPAKALEARVNALCPRVQALDRIENGLDVRLPDGQPLNLLQVADKA